MSLKAIAPGYYEATIVGGCFDKVGQKRTPAVQLEFRFKVGEEEHKIWHTLFLTDAATERSMDTLVGVMGFNEAKPLMVDFEGNNYFDDTFFASPKVQLNIVHETYEGKQYTKVKYINSLSSKKITGLRVEEVAGMNIKALAQAARARLGLQAATTTNTEDLPF